MTINRTFDRINTCCTKFIKVCKSYPCINTSFCTNTTPTGVDKANGPSHYQQLPGGKGGSICSQLVSNNTRSMGLANNNGLPVGTDAGALSNKTKPCNTVFFRGKTQNFPGGTGTSGERSHCRGTIDPGKLCFSNLPSGKEGRGTKTSSQPQEPQLLHKNGTLQDGGAPHPARPDPVSGLDDKDGSEGCLSSDTSVPRTPTPPPVSVECHNLPVQMPPIRPNISTSGVYQGVKTGGRDTETNGNSSNSISGRHSDNASEQGGIDAINSSDMSVLRRFRLGGQFEKITLDSRAVNGIFGVHGELSNHEVDPPSPEIEKNPAGCPEAPEAGEGISEGASKVPGKSVSCFQSSLAGRSPLQGPPENGECSDTREPITARLDTKVQCASKIDKRGNGGSKLVGLLRQHHDRIPFPSPDTSIDDRIRCIQHRLGRSSGGSVYRRCMVHRGGNAPYKLPGTASSLPSSSMFCKRATSSNNSVEAGQCDSHDIYQQNGRDTLRTAVSTSPLPLAMVPREGDIFGSCAPTRPRECSSRPRVQSNEGSVRLDARSHSIQTNSGSDGPLRGGFVCIPSDQTTASVLQLEAGSGGRRGGCIQSGLVSSKGLCQSTMVPDLSMSSSGEEATSQGSVNHPSMEHSTMVPSSTGAVRGLSPPATESGESCEMSINTGLHNETRGSNSDCMAHLRESFASRGLSSEATGLLLSSWRQKTKCSYNSAFSKWADWCKQRDRDPTSGPLEDVINFLAELFGQGYQYRSLNSYRSAISAVHAKIDGHAI